MIFPPTCSPWWRAPPRIAGSPTSRRARGSPSACRSRTQASTGGFPATARTTGATSKRARVLKPGGIAGFVDAVSPGAPLLDTYLQGIELLRDLSHVRDYSRAEWEAALVRAGLTPTSVTPHRVRLEFAVWIERMKTPTFQADAMISALAARSEPRA